MRWRYLPSMGFSLTFRGNGKPILNNSYLITPKSSFYYFYYFLQETKERKARIVTTENSQWD